MRISVLLLCFWVAIFSMAFLRFNFEGTHYVTVIGREKYFHYGHFLMDIAKWAFAALCTIPGHLAYIFEWWTTWKNISDSAKLTWDIFLNLPSILWFFANFLWFFFTTLVWFLWEVLFVVLNTVLELLYFMCNALRYPSMFSEFDVVMSYALLFTVFWAVYNLYCGIKTLYGCL